MRVTREQWEMLYRYQNADTIQLGMSEGGEDMNTCKSCVFWGRYRDKVCDAISLGEADNEPYINVRVADDHGLDADFVTTPDFGCTLFHAKGSAQ